MRGAGVTEPAGSVVQLDLAPASSPGADEVVVEVRAAGVGNWDDIMRSGGWPSGLPLPHALGVEAAGVVVAVGPAVDRSMLGSEVLTYAFPFHGGGAWAEWFVVAAGDVVCKPPSMSWAEAAVLPVPALTAAQALSAVTPQPGERVFVHGGGGVTGNLIVQLAVLSGAQVVASGGPSSMARIARFGARAVDRTRKDWPAQVRAAFGGPADVIVNAVPGGAVGLVSLVADPRRLASISGPTPGGAAEIFVRSDGGQLARLVHRFASGDLMMPTVRTLTLPQAATALELARRGAHGDAVALVLPVGPR